MPRANRRHKPGQPAAVVPSVPSVSIHKRQASELEASERALLRSVERGEWAAVASGPAVNVRYAQYAKTTLRHRRQT